MPKPPRSVRSDASNSDRLEPKLLRAVEANDVVQTKAVVDEARSSRQCSETFLSIGLARACDRNLVNVARFLLLAGANSNHVSPSGNKMPNLRRAAESGYNEIAELLIGHNADLEGRDKKGRTALMTAAWKGHLSMVKMLLVKGAHIDEVDYKRRNALHNFAAASRDDRVSGALSLEIVAHLLQAGVNVDATDELGRTALHWSTVTDNIELMRLLLTTRFRGASPKARTNAVDKRMKTSLHLAASHDRFHMAEILLQHGADVHAVSDGGWTALHNSCMHGTSDFVQLLLDSGADVNVELLNGRTPLHIAAEHGNIQAAECLVKHPDTKRSVKDRFGTTPLLLAAQHGKIDIAEMLAPWNRVSELSRDEVEASKQFSATIVDFGDYKNQNRVQRKSIYELLYARDRRNITKHAISTLPQKTKATKFRWIHLPANNIQWAEALLTKRFLEEGAVDVEGFKALETSFNHQHRGQLHHSRFMRPMVQVVHRTSAESEEIKPENPVYPSVIVEEPAPLTVEAGSLKALPSRKSQRQKQNSVSTAAGAEPGAGDGQEGSHSRQEISPTLASSEVLHPVKGKNAKKTPIRNDTASTVALSESSSNSKAHKRSDPLASKSRQPPSGEHLRAHSRKNYDKAAAPLSQRGLHSSCNIFMFMPYLHFETDSRRRAMQDAIEDPERLFHRVDAQADEVLIRAHLSRASSLLHVRRTLDQYYYHNIETQRRDSDQVVYRFQKKHINEVDELDPKIFMVDQLWMWVLGKDLVVTCFPQRWRQPRNDPLNVLEGIIENINSKTRDPVQNVYELSMTIAGRCFGTFDRHMTSASSMKFLEMFESSIGAAMDGEATLFQDFSRASQQASSWLQSHQRLESRSKTPAFFDRLLEIGAETGLLAEIKDIRDELDIIKMVLDHQYYLLPELRDAIRTIYKDERSHAALRKVEKAFDEQEKNITNPLKDLSRMDSQAGRIYESIRDLLDLKQKHANAFEARYSRDLAAGTARQGQTIMVFTIVTVIFLPLSFVAAFFAINIKELPHPAAGNGQQEMSLSYVSAYVFGIGLAISLPCIAVALSIDECNAIMSGLKRRFREKLWPHQQRVLDNKDEHELDTFPMDNTFSIAKSIRHSMDVGWDDMPRRQPRKSADVSWRRRSSKPEWDMEGGRYNDRG